MAEELRPEHLGQKHFGDSQAVEPAVVSDVTRWDHHLLLWSGVVPFFVQYVPAHLQLCGVRSKYGALRQQVESAHEGVRRIRASEHLLGGATTEVGTQLALRYLHHRGIR